MGTVFESDWECTRLKEQLAEAQAENALLREALSAMVSYARAEGKGLRIADGALSRPTDHNYLKEWLGEPVAWAYRLKNKSGWGGWHVTQIGAAKPVNIAFDEIEVIPLYAPKGL